jgi:hypothetical protein
MFHVAITCCRLRSGTKCIIHQKAIWGTHWASAPPVFVLASWYGSTRPFFCSCNGAPMTLNEGIDHNRSWCFLVWPRLWVWGIWHWQQFWIQWVRQQSSCCFPRFGMMKTSLSFVRVIVTLNLSLTYICACSTGKNQKSGYLPWLGNYSSILSSTQKF